MQQVLTPQTLLPIAKQTGRWTIKNWVDGKVLYTTNLGSYFRCRVTNTITFSLTVANRHSTLGPSQVYAIRVDRGHWHRFSAQPGKINCHLTLKPHIIEVMAAGNTDLDDVWYGNQGFAIKGVTLDRAGRLTPAGPRPSIDFIGDSITAGCWVNGRHAAIDYRPESNFAATCADLLNVDSVRIAYSAGGVLRPATGNVPVAKEFLTRIDSQTKWQPNNPRVVVVNLGVNDRHFTTATFATTYKQFIKQVIATFPNARVMMMVPFAQNFKSVITAIGTHYQLPVITTAGWCRSYTDGLHPDQAGSINAGKQLAQKLSPYFKKR